MSREKSLFSKGFFLANIDFQQASGASGNGLFSKGQALFMANGIFQHFPDVSCGKRS